MNVSGELLFFFSALGAFNGLVMGLYFLFFAKPRHISNRFLGTLLLMISIRIGKSVIFYFNTDLAYIYLQLGLTACFFIGPFLYFYVKSIHEPDGNITSVYKYHLMMLIPVIGIVGFLYPFETRPELWRPYIIMSIYTVWYLYIFASAYVVRGTIKNLFHKGYKVTSMNIWLLTVLFGNFVIVTSYVVMSFTFYLAGALTFSFIFYLLALFLFFNKKNKSVIFNVAHKYADKKIEATEATQLIEQLTLLIRNDEIYKNPNLKLPDVATQLNILPHKLSQLLNDNMGKNFTVFINEFRIAKAKELIQANERIKLEALGYDCGFNSKSTFYSVFKKIVGTTPAKFKERFS